MPSQDTLVSNECCIMQKGGIFKRNDFPQEKLKFCEQHHLIKKGKYLRRCQNAVCSPEGKHQIFISKAWGVFMKRILLSSNSSKSEYVYHLRPIIDLFLSPSSATGLEREI